MSTDAATETTTQAGPKEWGDIIDDDFWAKQLEELLATAHVVALKVIYAIVVLLVGWIVIKIVMWILGKLFVRLKFEPVVKSFVLAIINFFLWLVLWLQIFKILSIPNSSLTAVMAALAFALGLALSGTLNNVLAGIVLLTFKPFVVGDYIQGGGVEGAVTDIFLTYTVINTRDNQRCMVPNMPLATEVTVNFSKNENRRVDMSFTVAKDADLQATRKLLTKILKENPLILKDPAWTVQVSSLDASWVTWIVRPWCKTADLWTVLTDVHRAVKNRCDEVGISIAFPQREVHLFRQPTSIKDGFGDEDADVDDAANAKAVVATSTGSSATAAAATTTTATTTDDNVASDDEAAAADEKREGGSKSSKKEKKDKKESKKTK
jgi:small conductance mechanosensitive channel